MIRFFYALFFSCLFLSSWAQEAVVKGNIIDSETQKPVKDALVQIENTKNVQRTNELGGFIFNEDVPIGEIAIAISKDGYAYRRFKITTVENKTATIKDINLYPEDAEDKPRKEKIELTGTSLTGIVTDKQTKEIITGARVTIVGSFMTTETDSDGRFVFNGNVPEGPIVIKVDKEGYGVKKYDIFISFGKIANVDGITLGNDLYDIENRQINTYAEDQLFDGNTTVTNFSRFYQSSNNVFLNIAAYQFSPSFFKARGQDAASGNVMINGVSINTPTNGAADWNTIGGLEEVMQNNFLDYGLKPSKYAVGGTLGNLSINTRASEYRKGGKVSYLSSNRRFSHGLNATYASGMSTNGFAIALSATKRLAIDEGYFDGTPYDSNAFFISAEARLSGNSTLNFTAYATATERAGRSANTEEVFSLKDNKYNSFWGLQSEDIRNSRKQNVSQPFFMLSHYLNLGSNIKLQTNLAYSFGSNTRSNIDFRGTNFNGFSGVTPSPGINPDPTLASKLPSAFLSDADNPDYDGAFLAEEAFRNNGQINWFDFFDANINSGLDNAIYALYEDVIEDSNFTFNSIATININPTFNVNASLGYTSYTSKNFARLKNLLGAQGYLDVSALEGTGDAIQSNLLNPNRIVSTDETFRYNYNLNKTSINAFLQGVYKMDQFSAFIGGSVAYNTNWREGNYLSGSSPNISLGEGRKHTFLDYTVKGGLGYAIDAKNQINIRGAYGVQAPHLNTLFVNARESDNPRAIETGLTDEESLEQAEDLIPVEQATTLSAELNYTYKSAKLKASISGFYNKVSDASSNTTFLGTSVSTETSSTIQEVLTGVDKQYMGLEFGMSYDILNVLTLKGAAAYGNYTYANNPNLQYVISEANVVDLGEVFLQDYKLSAGPLNMYSLGFEYRDPTNWWFEAMGNYTANQYLAVNPYLRTREFFLDTDGAPFENFNMQDAASLLKQEKLDDYLTVNISGGKFWELKNNYIGVKAGINNVLGQTHDVGGYETQGHLKYDILLEDAQRTRPLYGNRYWRGYGATYFVNVYYRF